MGLRQAQTFLTVRGSEKKKKEKEKGCFPSLVAAEADGRVGSSSCDLHIGRAHLIQNQLTALVPHVETRTHTPSHFPFPLLRGQTCILPVPRGKGPEANELAKWNCVVIARHRPAPSSSVVLLVLPASPHQAPRDIPLHLTASMDIVDSSPESPMCKIL